MYFVRSCYPAYKIFLPIDAMALTFDYKKKNSRLFSLFMVIIYDPEPYSSFFILPTGNATTLICDLKNQYHRGAYDSVSIL